MISESNGPRKFHGNDKLLFGIILGVITFWLFAQTTLNIAPDMGKDLGLDASDEYRGGDHLLVLRDIHRGHGRVSRPCGPRQNRQDRVLSQHPRLSARRPRAAGTMASAFLLTGRALQGLSGACIMPASLALVKTYWDGAPRQRAVSLWSIGSWGGSGLCSYSAAWSPRTSVGATSFFASVVVALVGLILIRARLKAKPRAKKDYKFDFAGVIAFMIAMVALQIFVTQGNRLGWTTSPDSFSSPSQ